MLRRKGTTMTNVRIVETHTELVECRFFNEDDIHKYVKPNGDEIDLDCVKIGDIWDDEVDKRWKITVVDYVHRTFSIKEIGRASCRERV